MLTKVTEKQAKNWAKMILNEEVTYSEIENKSGGEYYFSLVSYHVSKYIKTEDGEIEKVK